MNRTPDDIRKAIEQGYSLKDIKNILAEAGISVSVAKMQAILERQEGSEKTPSTRPLNEKTPDKSGAPISKN